MVVGTQCVMQVEPERLRPAENTANDLVVDRQQPRPLPGKELARRHPPDSGLVAENAPGSVGRRPFGQVGSLGLDHVDVMLVKVKLPLDVGHLETGT